MKLKSEKHLPVLADVMIYFLLVIMFFICVYPFYYIFLFSISNPSEAQKGITLIPRGITISNYITVFKLKGMLNAAMISVLRTVAGTAITLYASTFFAFLVTREKLPFRKLSYRFVIITMYFNAGLIPWYLTMKFYHLNNNFLLYVIPGAISAYYIVLIKTFIEQLPPALEESAKIDGAGYITIFRKVIFPLSKPIIATIMVFAAVGQWNTWFDNFFLVQNPNLKTLQLILYEYLSEANALATASNDERTRAGGVVMTPQSIRMTVTMVTTLPILFVYPFMQRYFVKGIMMGAVKG